MTPWAQVIGDPSGHSLSLMIHRYWAGSNTHVDGTSEALAGLPIHGQTLVVIGAGDAARAAVHWLGQARRSFVLFFGTAAPLDKDAKLRALITTLTT